MYIKYINVFLNNFFIKNKKMRLKSFRTVSKPIRTCVSIMLLLFLHNFYQIYKRQTQHGVWNVCMYIYSSIFFYKRIYTT